MGRKRTKNHNLPPRMHQKGNVYYYVASRGSKRVWERLSDVYHKALALWAQKEGTHQHGETVADAINRYLVEGAHLKVAKTYKEYQRQAQRLRAVWREFHLDDVRPVHVYQYLDSRPEKVALNREIALLSTIFAHAMRWGWCDGNPCKGVHRHSEKPRDRYLEDAEVNRLREVANDQFRCIIEFAYLTAMRKGDILRLKLSDVREDGIYLEQGKTGKHQYFEMTPEIRSLLARIRGLRRRIGSLSLFCNRTGQPYTEGGFNSNWKRLVRRSGVDDVHFHDRRAKALTDAKRDGMGWTRLRRSPVIRVVIPLRALREGAGRGASAPIETDEVALSASVYDSGTNRGRQAEGELR